MSTAVADTPNFAQDGAQLFRAALSESDLVTLRSYADGIGARLSGAAIEQAIAPATLLARTFLGEAARPVRAVLFDKTAEQNWALGWHQDRTIAVRHKVEAPGFGPWTTKQGIPHVAPPADILADMVTLRLHLDPCGMENAPLIVALGSHRLGFVAASEAASRAAALPRHTCVADTGDIWIYATLILHASDRAIAPSRRRVLQIDYAAFDLPQGMEWRGLA